MSSALSLSELLAERARRQRERDGEAERLRAEQEAEERREAEEQEKRRGKWAAIAAKLRASLFEEQLVAFVRAKDRRVADLCTRRAGKTFGGMREMVAYALENAKSRQVYVNETGPEVRRLAWSEPDDGVIAVLAAVGLTRGERRGDGSDFWANETELEVRFANGSKIVFLGADDEKQVDKLRGLKWHRVWVDEAQKFPHLETLVKRAVGASMADFKGQIWITGTPSKDTSGYFFEVTRDDGQPAAPGWSVHRWAVVDNPFFGRVVEVDGHWQVVDQFQVVHSEHDDADVAMEAARTLRWEQTAGEAIRLNGWGPEDPDLLREYYGRWVLTDANFVYPIHAVADQRKLIFAPVRMKSGALSDGKPVTDLYDHRRAREDLPRNKRGRPHTWLYSVGLDFGYDPDGFSIVVLAFSMTHEVCHEMYSWKKTKTDTYEQRDRVKNVLDQLDEEGDALACIVGDPAGTRSLLKGWRERAYIPVEEADKQEKDTWIDLFGADVRRGLFAYRGLPPTDGTPSHKTDSPLLDEHRHLVWMPVKNGKRVAHKHRKLLDGRIPADHCSDGNLYGWRHAMNWLARPDVGPRSPEERLAAEGEAIAKQVDEAYSKPQRKEQWGMLDEYDDMGGWS